MQKAFSFVSDDAQIGDIEQNLRKEGFEFVIGVDEVGRGPLAGPVTATAVLISLVDLSWCQNLNDSKKLSSKKRQQLQPIIRTNALAIEIEHADPDEIAEKNILWASIAAMKRAVLRILASHQFGDKKTCILVDGNRKLPISFPHQFAIIKGDGRCFSIAAASIIAKEIRDAIMINYDAIYPGYGFKRHKGYPTKEHIKALQSLGITPIHRKTFAPVQKAAKNAKNMADNL